MFWEQAAWAMAPQPGQGADAPPQLGLIWVLVPLMVIFWLFLVAPQRKQQKQHQQRIESLKKGDRVVTNGGIYGTVVKTEEHSIVLAVGEMGGMPPLKKKAGGETSVNVRFSKAAITTILSEASSEGEQDS